MNTLYQSICLTLINVSAHFLIYLDKNEAVYKTYFKVRPLPYNFPLHITFSILTSVCPSVTDLPCPLMVQSNLLFDWHAKKTEYTAITMIKQYYIIPYSKAGIFVLQGPIPQFPPI